MIVEEETNGAWNKHDVLINLIDAIPKYVFIGGGGPHNAQPKSPGELLHKSLKSQLRNILSKNHTLD